MSLTLTSYAQRLLRDPDTLRRELDVPLLMWESGDTDAASTVTRTQDRVQMTNPGRVTRRPASGDPIVIEVKKHASATNPFAMGVTVGRTENNDICLPDASVSRFHAFFQQDSKKTWTLVDAESRNGTWVNALKLGPRQAVALSAGNLIRFADVQVTFHTPHSFLDYLEKKMS